MKARMVRFEPPRPATVIIGNKHKCDFVFNRSINQQLCSLAVVARHKVNLITERYIVLCTDFVPTALDLFIPERLSNDRFKGFRSFVKRTCNSMRYLIRPIPKRLSRRCTPSKKRRMSMVQAADNAIGYFGLKKSQGKII